MESIRIRLMGLNQVRPIQTFIIRLNQRNNQTVILQFIPHILRFEVNIRREMMAQKVPTIITRRLQYNRTRPPRKGRFSFMEITLIHLAVH